MIPHDDVEETMADLAVVFHWQPAAMDPMPLRELHRWHARARARAEPKADG